MDRRHYVNIFNYVHAMHLHCGDADASRLLFTLKHKAARTKKCHDFIYMRRSVCL